MLKPEYIAESSNGQQAYCSGVSKCDSEDIPLGSPGDRWRGASLRFFRQSSNRWYAQLAVIELILLVLSCQLATYTRFGFALPLPEVASALDLYPWKAGIYALTIWTSMLALGLYQRHGKLPSGMHIDALLRIILALSAGAIGLMVVYFIVPSLAMGRGLLVLAILWSFISLMCSRIIFLSVANGDFFKRRVLLLGCGNRAQELLKAKILESSISASAIVGYLPLSSERSKKHNDGNIALKRLELKQSLLETCGYYKIDDIVIAADNMRDRLELNELVGCRLAGIKVFRIEEFYERELGSVMLEKILPSWFVFGASFDQSLIGQISKRGFDLICALIITVFALPIMLIVAFAVWVESGFKGPVFYRQVRVGERGRRFHLVKFRSMREDAERDGVARWASQNDERITRIGRIIRQLRFDELPQLWNVFRGEMSIVGPRPERPEFVESLKSRIPYYGVRHCIPPGLTGWAQLRYPYGASVLDAAEKLRYDLFYLKHRSLLFDLQILLQTFEIILFRRGGR